MHEDAGKVPGRLQFNNDGTAFRAYRLEDLPQDFVIMSSNASENENTVLANR